MFVPVDRDAIAGGTLEMGVPGWGAVNSLPNQEQMPSASGEVRALGLAHVIIAVSGSPLKA